MAGEILSKSEYARHHGVDPATVRSWVHRGQLTAPAVREDGRIDVAHADAQLRERLDAVNSTARGGPRDLFEPAPGAPKEASTTPFSEVRLRKLQLQVEAEERKAAVQRGELVEAAGIEAAWSRQLEELLLTVEQWLPELVTELGGGRTEMDLARTRWRALRARLAAAAQDEVDRAA